MKYRDSVCLRDVQCDDSFQTLVTLTTFAGNLIPNEILFAWIIDFIVW